jgi:KDO2-lipid IV(A) lauroyltransferase
LLRQGGDHPGRTAPPPRPVVGRLAGLALRGLALLPLPLLRLLGANLGLLASWLPVRERRVTEVNLEIAFPDLDPRERRRLARRSMVHTGRTFAELSAIWTWGSERLHRHVLDVCGDEAVNEAIESGRGVIVALPHLGAWELLGVYCPRRWPFSALYRPPRMRELERFVRGSRERHGARLVPAGKGAVRSLYRAIGNGEIVAILPDQDAGEGAGIFVPFFGETANTMVLLPRLAARTRALVVLGWVERVRGGFRVHFVPASEAIHDSDLQRSAESMNRDVERLVRGCPEQYLWSYKRFRIRPPGTPDPYR